MAKRVVATAITNTLVEHFDARRENVVVVFSDVPLDSWARGGTLNVDRDHK